MLKTGSFRGEQLKAGSVNRTTALIKKEKSILDSQGKMARGLERSGQLSGKLRTVADSTS